MEKSDIPGHVEPVVRKPMLSKVPVFDELFHALHDYGRRKGPRFTVHGVFMGPDKWCEFQDAMAKEGRHRSKHGYRMFGARIMMSTSHGDGITVF